MENIQYLPNDTNYGTLTDLCIIFLYILENPHLINKYKNMIISLKRYDNIYERMINYINEREKIKKLQQ